MSRNHMTSSSARRRGSRTLRLPAIWKVKKKVEKHTFSNAIKAKPEVNNRLWKKFAPHDLAMWQRLR
jgi:ribosomal protein L31E